jgi:hypothetical protein
MYPVQINQLLTKSHPELEDNFQSILQQFADHFTSDFTVRLMQVVSGVAQ